MKKIMIINMCIVAFNINAQSLSSVSRGNKFNPSIGLNALTLFQNNSRNSSNDGLSIQEVELQFSSDIDAYLRAEATIGIHQEESSGDEHEHGFAIEPEEVFAETIAIPNVTFKVGKFLANFGKLNTIHSHAQPFIHRSVVQEHMFGDEGLAESGISGSFLIPLQWFSEFTIQVLQPTNEDLFTDSHHSLAYLANFKNLWELSDSLTFEMGLSNLAFSSHDHGSEVEDSSKLYGADFTFKWKPVNAGKTSSFMWSTEFIHKDRSGSNTDKNGGVTTYIRQQLSKRVFAQAKYEFIGFGKNEDVKDTNSYAGLIAFVPTEFSSVRLQYESLHDGSSAPERKISAQLNFSIGAHPAHTY